MQEENMNNLEKDIFSNTDGSVNLYEEEEKNEDNIRVLEVFDDLDDVSVEEMLSNQNVDNIFKNSEIMNIYLDARINFEKVVECVSQIGKFFTSTSVYSCNSCLKVRKETIKARDMLKSLRKKLLIFGNALRKENKGKRGRKRKM